MNLNAPIGHEPVDYTVAICTWNRADQLARTLEQLSHLEVPRDVTWRVLVIDNASTDATPDVLKAFAARLPLEHLFESRRGKSFALNRAARNVSSRWILWTDDDVLVPANWLSTYDKAVKAWPECVYFGGPTVAEVDGPLPAWLQTHWVLLSGVYGERDLGPETRLIDEKCLPWGANFAIRTDIAQLYQFNTRLGRQGKRRLSGEENELCRQLLRDGRTGRWLPDALVRHCVPRSALTRGFVYRYFLGLGQTMARKRLHPAQPRQIVRLARSTVARGLRYVQSRFSTPHGDLALAAAACTFAGEFIGSLDSHRHVHSGGREKMHRGRQPGRPPLHAAAAHRDAHAAVDLLLDGHDWRQEDASGRAPLELGEVDLPFLHDVRQGLRRARGSRATPLAEAAVPVFEALETNGIVHVPGLLMPEQLSAMREGFAAFVAHLDSRVASGEGLYSHYDEEEHWWPNDAAHVTNNAFKHCPELAGLTCHPLVGGVADAYFGSLAHVTRAVGMRYQPMQSRNNDMFGWHHDLEDKRLKMMVLLSDVGPGDQTMSYIEGSHTLRYGLQRFLNNAASIEECEARMGTPPRVRDTVGKAGDVFLFDSNGVHRGNRRADAAMRDALFVEFCTDTSDIWGADLQAVSTEVRAAARLALIGTAPRKWHHPATRNAPAWVESLPHLGLWLPAALTAHGRGD